TDQVEPPAGWNPAWPARRSQPTAVLSHQVYRTALGYQIVQLLAAPGCVGPLRQSVLLPDAEDYIECEAWWTMGLETAPEATYIAYPFTVPAPTARFDVGGQAVIVDTEQLLGVCRDYFTVQGWVDLSGQNLGVTIATPDNPMVQLGGFQFAQHQASVSLERAVMLGWVTNNYWETNFRAHQPGPVHCRYRILPYAGAFDEARAHRFGLEAAQAQPLVQHMGEVPLSSALFPTTGSLLELPSDPILVTHVKPAAIRPYLIVRLLNASDESQRVELGSALLEIGAAWLCDLLETPLRTLVVHDGKVHLELEARRFATVRLLVRVSGAEQS
ncbi:MAG TPA: glycosyl hydrolase-related protein, partial [Roseiflexaceae bacterium]|nr:glycosyl hydrolase-related protein [Roseiflexaceae bacterium]